MDLLDQRPAQARRGTAKAPHYPGRSRLRRETGLTKVNSRLVIAGATPRLPVWARLPARVPGLLTGAGAVVGVLIVAVHLALTTEDPDFVAVGGNGQLVSRLVACESGVLALVLLGVSTAGGLALTLSAAPGAPRQLNRQHVNKTHLFVAGFSVVFTAIHLVSVGLVAALGVGWLQLLVPFTRAGSPVAQAFGVLAVYLLLAVGLSSVLRRRLPWRIWRQVHLLTIPLFGLACGHAVLAETRSGSALFYGLLLGTAGVILTMFLLQVRAARRPVRAARVIDSSAPATPPAITPPSQDFPLSLLIVQATWEADGIMSLVLKAPRKGTELPLWGPGAHLQMALPSGRVRLYSLCGDPAERDRYRVAILRQETGNGGSREIHNELRVGTVLAVARPRNGFPLYNAGSYLLLAGGIGIAAILPMAQTLLAQNRPWRMVYSGRRLDQMAFVDQALALAPDRVDIWPSEERGRLNLAGLVAAQLPGTAVYCCGPPSMIEELTGLAAGRPDLRLHTEGFTPAAPPAGGAPVEVALRRSGARVRVAADSTILDAVGKFVPGLAAGCGQGICGRCQVTVLAGEPEHRDTVLSEADRAAGKMLLCVSRAKGNQLTLDL